MNLSLDVQRSADHTTVVVVGDVDIDTSEELRGTLIGLGDEGGLVVVDCSGLEFVDSTGLAALLAAHKAISAKGGSLQITKAPPMLVKLVRIVGLDGLLQMTPA